MASLSTSGLWVSSPTSFSLATPPSTAIANNKKWRLSSPAITSLSPRYDSPPHAVKPPADHPCRNTGQTLARRPRTLLGHALPLTRRRGPLPHKRSNTRCVPEFLVSSCLIPKLLQWLATDEAHFVTVDGRPADLLPNVKRAFDAKRACAYPPGPFHPTCSNR